MSKPFAARMKSYREMKNLTQQNMSEILGVSLSTARSWEKGELYPRQEIQFVGIASLLGVSVEWLKGEVPIDQLPVGESAGSKTGDTAMENEQQDVISYEGPVDLSQYVVHEVLGVGMQVIHEKGQGVVIPLKKPEVHFVVKSQIFKNGVKVREEGEFVRVFYEEAGERLPENKQ